MFRTGRPSRGIMLIRLSDLPPKDAAERVCEFVETHGEHIVDHFPVLVRPSAGIPTSALLARVSTSTTRSLTNDESSRKILLNVRTAETERTIRWQRLPACFLQRVPEAA